MIDQTIATDYFWHHSQIQKKKLASDTTLANILSDCSYYETPKPLYPKDVAKIWCQLPFSIKYNMVSPAFHLVVGATAEDMIWAWNRSLVSSGHNGRDVLWIPRLSLLEEDGFMSVLSQWLLRVYWNNEQSNIRGYLISSSVAADELKKSAEQIQKSTCNMHWLFCHQPGQLYNTLEFDKPWQLVGMRSSLDDIGVSSTQECSFNSYSQYSTRVTLRPTIPSFVTNPNVDGKVVAEIDVKYQPYGMERQTSNLCLPKRYSISESLFPGNQSRSAADGKLSVIFSCLDPRIDMEEPSMQSVLRTFGYSIPDTANSKASPYVSGKYIFQISSAGKALHRLLQIFGGLEFAKEFFEDPFWVDLGLQFCNLKSLEQQEEQEIECLIRELAQLQAGIPELRDVSAEPMRRLAEGMMGKLNRWNKKEKFISFDEIRKKFKSFRDKRLKDSNQRNRWESVSFDDHYESGLQSYLDKGVFRMGTLLKCDYCRHEAWFLIERVKHVVDCMACSLSISIPLSPKWTFKLHDTVRESIIENSLPILIRELGHLNYSINSMFDFLPCQNIYKADQKEPITDLDLIIFTAEKLIIGEVKSEPARLTAIEVSKLRDVAKEILPQEVCVVA